jgi:hypothetical protein
MKRSLQLSIVLLAVSLLVGCVASGINEKYLTGKEKESETGLVVVSYAISGQWRNSQNAEVWFRSLDEKIKGTVNNPASAPRYLISGERLPDPAPADLFIDVANPVGGVNVLRLPAGEYEFYFFDSRNAKPLPTALIRAGFQARANFKAKFTVKPGTTTYVGRLHFHYPPDVRVTFKIVDKSKEDLLVLKREHEQLRETPVEVAVPSFAY